MIASTRHRLIARGDLPGSDGGVYNPGALMTDEGIVLLARREIDYRFTPIVHAERIVLDPDSLALRSHRTLVRRGYPDGARIEDFRLMRHAGEILAVHTLVHGGRIRPMLSRLTERHIEPAGSLIMPFEVEPIEKNWVLFEHEGGGTHSAIFVDWADPSARVATMMSYPGQRRDEPGRYGTYALSSAYRIIRMTDDPPDARPARPARPARRPRAHH